MALLHTSCSRFSDNINCPSCNADKTVKNGRTANNKQQYICKTCGKRFIKHYCYKAYTQGINKNIVALTKEGVGIRSTARLLDISPTTLLSRIKFIASNIIEPPLFMGKEYEVDELRTYVKKKAS